MRKLEGVLSHSLSLLQIVVQLLILGEFSGEYIADLVGNALAVLGDRITRQVLIFRHFRENGLNAVRHAGGDLVHLLVLHLLRFLRRFGEGIVGHHLLGDGLGQGVHPLGIELLHLLVRTEHVGLALGDRVPEQLVGRLDLPAIFIRSSLERVVRLALPGDLGLLRRIHLVHGLLVKPKRSADDQQSRKDNGG